jgi:pSer/pThr/pTyr-binding forkhead associated (FHA) protein
MVISNPENQGIPIQSLAKRAPAWTPQVFAKQLAEMFLVGSPLEEEEDESDSEEWAYQTTYIQSIPEVSGRMAFIDVKRTAVYPLRKARKGPFMDTVLVGRSASNDLCIDHTSISKLHARIRRLGEGSWRLSDAGSLNGTKINDRPLSGDAPVRDGDRIVFGSLAFEVYDAKRLHHLLLRLK